MTKQTEAFLQRTSAMKKKKQGTNESWYRLGRRVGILALGCLAIGIWNGGYMPSALATEAGRLETMTLQHDNPSGSTPQAERKLMSIVIDDFGNGMKGTEQMMNLPIKITVAVMPFLPTTKQDATEAHKRGHDVLVHLPMEPKHGRPEWLGPGAITSNLTNQEVRAKVNAAIDDVPFAIGMNNHMGSKVTSDPRIMSVVLDVCKERGLFFVDSRTNYRSVVPELAVEKGLPPVRNDIFLDDQHTVSHVSKQMKVVAEWLNNHDTCVTIGHVGGGGMYTSSVIRSTIPSLSEQVKFVGIGDLVRTVWGWKPEPTIPTNEQ